MPTKRIERDTGFTIISHDTDVEMMRGFVADFFLIQYLYLHICSLINITLSTHVYKVFSRKYSFIKSHHSYLSSPIFIQLNPP